MKTNFAITLSFDGIQLLHRAAGGWRRVGTIAPDVENLTEALEGLRQQALLLEPSGLVTKLLLPNDQIKYLTIDTKDMSATKRFDAARTSLDGATPYAVDDLAFDICPDDAQTHIAAVAKETLAEAEAFAVEHDFNPVSFSAIPGDNAYLGAPFFGMTNTADAVLDGAELEHDDIAVVIIGDAKFPHSEASRSEGADQAETDLKSPVADEPVATTTPEEQEAALAPQEPAEDPPLFAAKTRTDAETEDAARETDALTAQALSKAAQAATASQKAKEAGVVPPPRPPIAAEAPPLQAAPTAGFASRRSLLSEPSKSRRAPGLSAPSTDAGTSNTAPPISASYADVIIPPRVPAPEPEVAKAPSDAAAPAKRGFLSRRSGKRRDKETPAIAAAQPQATASPTEAERMTIFGARRADIGGKPRFLGLMLTAALLVFLAGVAAWASVFLDDNISLSRLFGERSKPAFSTPVTKADEPPEPVIVAPELPEEPGVITASLDPALSSEDSAVLDALRVPLQPLAEEDLTQAELEAKYAATGIWPRAPQVPSDPAGLIDIEDLYLTSIDPISPSADAIALPAPGSFATDETMVALTSPAPPGMEFNLNAQGLVIPTPEGTLSPEGIVVYLGRPDVVPPVTPTRFQTEPEDTAARSTLAALRPRDRPEDLTESYERGRNDGLTQTELATLRPALRPPSLQEQAAALAAPDPIETDDAVTAALMSDSGLENATKLAIAASARPDPRPQNFARIVRRAEQAKPAEEVRVASAAATVAPRTVAPSIPSTASVAKQATVKNALNLRRVNLIGVYGKPSARRALIRLGNGRYQKVTVGDRIDGGRVSAIGESELRYTKGGRSVVLSMPGN